MSCATSKSSFFYKNSASFGTAVSLCSDSPPWQSLISSTLPIHERISLVTMIFSNSNQINAVRNLSRKDAQDFIDNVDEVSSQVVLGGVDPVQSEPRRSGVGWSHAANPHEMSPPSI